GAKGAVRIAASDPILDNSALQEASDPAGDTDEAVARLVRAAFLEPAGRAAHGAAGDPHGGDRVSRQHAGAARRGDRDRIPAAGSGCAAEADRDTAPGRRDRGFHRLPGSSAADGVRAAAVAARAGYPTVRSVAGHHEPDAIAPDGTAGALPELRHAGTGGSIPAPVAGGGVHSHAAASELLVLVARRAHHDGRLPDPGSVPGVFPREGPRPAR